MKRWVEVGACFHGVTFCMRSWFREMNVKITRNFFFQSCSEPYGLTSCRSLRFPSCGGSIQSAGRFSSGNLSGTAMVAGFSWHYKVSRERILRGWSSKPRRGEPARDGGRFKTAVGEFMRATWWRAFQVTIPRSWRGGYELCIFARVLRMLPARKTRSPSFIWIPVASVRDWVSGGKPARGSLQNKRHERYVHLRTQ